MSNPGDEHVGTATFNVPRLFDIDPVGEVMVGAGDYPIYRTPGGDYYWVMVGQPNRHIHETSHHGGGLFTLNHRDEVDHDAPPVVFQSLLLRPAHIRAEIANPTRRVDGTPYYAINLEVPV